MDYRYYSVFIGSAFLTTPPKRKLYRFTTDPAELTETYHPEDDEWARAAVPTLPAVFMTPMEAEEKRHELRVEYLERMFAASA